MEPWRNRNIKRPIISNEIETVISKLSTCKRPGLDGFPGEFYQTFKVELTPSPLKLFQKFTEEGILPNSFYKAIITLTPKPDSNTNTQKI